MMTGRRPTTTAVWQKQSKTSLCDDNVLLEATLSVLPREDKNKSLKEAAPPTDLYSENDNSLAEPALDGDSTSLPPSFKNNGRS